MKSKRALVGTVIASEYRRKILRALEKSSVTPSQIADITKLNRVHVSRFLRELRDDGMVTCETPDLRKGKLYSLSDLGKSVLGSVAELEKSSKESF